MTDALFDEYKLSDAQRQIFHAMKGLRNMPDSFKALDDEELIWTVAVGTFGIPSEPTASDMRFYQGKVEERIRRLDEADRRYSWSTLQWTKPAMRRLIKNWFCGMLVIDPNLKTRDGHPIQFVREWRRFRLPQSRGPN